MIKKNYKYLGIKQEYIKDKIKKEYIRRTWKQLETKLSLRNLVKGINTWAVLLERYLGPFLKWTREELKQMYQRTRKIMTIHKVLNPRANIDRLYASWKEGGRFLASIEDSVDASIQRRRNYTEKRGEELITATRNDSDSTKTSRRTLTWKHNSMGVLNG